MGDYWYTLQARGVLRVASDVAPLPCLMSVLVCIHSAIAWRVRLSVDERSPGDDAE